MWESRLPYRSSDGCNRTHPARNATATRSARLLSLWARTARNFSLIEVVTLRLERATAGGSGENGTNNPYRVA